MPDNETDTGIVTKPDLTPEELVIEIKKRVDNTTQNIIEIGVLLIQAKKQVEHGEWSTWLADNIDFTIRTADRFMKCAERFANWTPASNLNSSQMFELLALRSADTEDFFNQKVAEGKNIESMSKKTLREEVKQWKKDKRNQKNNSANKNSQMSSSEVPKEQLKKLNTFLNLSNNLANVDDFEKLIEVYAEKNSEKMKSYAKTLLKIAQSIQNVVG